MTTKYYRIGLVYVGAFGGPDDSDITAEPPAGAVESPAPARADDVWNETTEAWDSSPNPVVEPEPPLLQALRDLTEDLGPPHTAKFIVRFGPRPGQGQGLL